MAAKIGRGPDSERWCCAAREPAIIQEPEKYLAVRDSHEGP